MLVLHFCTFLYPFCNLFVHFLCFICSHSLQALFCLPQGHDFPFLIPSPSSSCSPFPKAMILSPSMLPLPPGHYPPPSMLPPLPTPRQLGCIDYTRLAGLALHWAGGTSEACCRLSCCPSKLLT